MDHRVSVNATLPVSELAVALDNQKALLIYAIGATVFTVQSVMLLLFIFFFFLPYLFDVSNQIKHLKCKILVFPKLKFPGL